MDFIYNRRMPAPDIASQCSIARASQLVGDGWTVMLLRELFWGASRYEAFATNTGMASNVLASRLKRLLEADVVSKTPVPEDGRRFDYALTARGRELFPLLMSIMAWGDKHVPGQQGPLVLLRHRACGKRTKPGLVCTACGAALGPQELDTEFNKRYEAAYGPLQARTMPTYAELAAAKRRK
jgi:DNA-binding HxlR family transcriptional regulator